MKTAIIGVGNMGGAILQSLLHTRVFSRNDLIACDTDQDKLKAFDCQITSDLRQAVNEADIILLAVKPQVLAGLLQTLADTQIEGKLWISIAAGVSSMTIKTSLKDMSAKVVRAMPNTPARIGKGMTGWYASPEVTVDERAMVQTMLASFGKQIRFEQEADIDRVTAVSGSGPAYFFYLVEALAKAGADLGLDLQTSYELARQTCIGAASLLAESALDVSELRRQVTSKGGTTAAALARLDDLGCQEHCAAAVQAAYEQARLLVR